MTREKVLDHRGLACFLEQEAVMTVGRVDDVKLDVLAARPKGIRQLFGACRRIEPVRAEGNQQCSRRYGPKRVRERAPSVLAREVEVSQRPGGVEVGVRIEALDERIGLMTQVVFDLKFGLPQNVANVIGKLQPSAEFVA